MCVCVAQRNLTGKVRTGERRKAAEIGKASPVRDAVEERGREMESVKNQKQENTLYNHVNHVNVTTF